MPTAKGYTHIIYTDSIASHVDRIGKYLETITDPVPIANVRRSDRDWNVSTIAEISVIKLAREIQSVSRDQLAEWIDQYQSVKKYSAGRKKGDENPGKSVKKRHEGEKNIQVPESSVQAILDIVAHLKSLDLAPNKVLYTPPTKKANQKLAFFLALNYMASTL